MKTTLVIMAAGIGSRYGGGVKQLEAVGKNDEIIIDYSIHDAIEAGFNKIVFIIRKDIEADFRAVIGNRIEKIAEKTGVEIAYAFQALDDLPEGVSVPAGRKKPWGTGQAVLACKGIVHEPFVVINADDYYGKTAYSKIHEFLLDYSPEHPEQLCMAGFILKNTLSENGGVTRGVSEVDERGYLTKIKETYGIEPCGDGARDKNGNRIDPETYVSMNMWGLTPEFIDLLETGFVDFFQKIKGNEEKAEFLLPTFIGELLKEQKVSVKVLETGDSWFGVTYREDKEAVTESFGRLIDAGVYQTKLFDDLIRDA